MTQSVSETGKYQMSFFWLWESRPTEKGPLIILPEELVLITALSFILVVSLAFFLTGVLRVAEVGLH